MLYDPTKFETKKELIDFLYANKKTIIAQKKAEIKHSDAISAMFYESKSDAIKENQPFAPENGEFKVKAVINTTNFMDSHDDVHLDGIWNKSLRQNRNIMMLQEHQLQFDKIIADGSDLEAYAKTLDWNKLGYQYSGQTQALIFEFNLKKDRNSFMFDQYSKGFVKNHSVGMQYIQIDMAINNKDYEEEYKIWQSYFDKIANKELAEYKGYFFAVKEAKLIEGSAVPIGSNPATPTLDNNAKSQPPSGIDDEPSQDTQQWKIIMENLNL